MSDGQGHGVYDLDLLCARDSLSNLNVEQGITNTYIVNKY